MYQIVVIVGHLGRDMELRYTPNGTAVASGSVATNRRWKQDDELKEEVEWHNLTCWGGRGEFMGQYGKKGRLLLIQGRIKTDRYEKDGETKYFTKIVVDVVQFLDSPPDEPNVPAPEDGRPDTVVRVPAPADEVEVPF